MVLASRSQKSTSWRSSSFSSLTGTCKSRPKIFTLTSSPSSPPSAASSKNGKSDTSSVDSLSSGNAKSEPRPQHKQWLTKPVPKPRPKHCASVPLPIRQLHPTVWIRLPTTHLRATHLPTWQIPLLPALTVALLMLVSDRFHPHQQTQCQGLPVVVLPNHHTLPLLVPHPSLHHLLAMAHLLLVYPRILTTPTSFLSKNKNRPFSTEPTLLMVRAETPTKGVILCTDLEPHIPLVKKSLQRKPRLGTRLWALMVPLEEGLSAAS